MNVFIGHPGRGGPVGAVEGCAKGAVSLPGVLGQEYLWCEQCSGQWGREVGGSADVTQGIKGSMCIGWRELCPVPN